MATIIDQLERESMKESVPAFAIGDTVKVNVRIKEGDKERIQAFEGVVIARKNGGVRETFTVRKMSYGVGVEKSFPVHSPKIASIEVVRKGKPRRAKLYYVRDLTGKAAKVKSADNK
ncbi:MAG: 50S ribosomal protein L19 [Clostridia bacterium]|nr:50S ribosomal protein L19 [Clostridia bacterium]